MIVVKKTWLRWEKVVGGWGTKKQIQDLCSTGKNKTIKLFQFTSFWDKAAAVGLKLVLWYCYKPFKRGTKFIFCAEISLLKLF